MTQRVSQARWHSVGLVVLCVLLSHLAGGCVYPPASNATRQLASAPASDPTRVKLLQHIREAYLFEVDVSDFELLSVPEIVARLDPDTHLVKMRRMSLDFIRGFEPEDSVGDVRDLGGGRGYLRLRFFGRRTFEDMRSALQHFTPPLCALTIDLRDNSGGNFDQALRLAGLFLPAGAPLTVYEDRQGRTPLYATEKHVPRQERLTLLINATSASSAELFAGVLHWYHRAELVGTPTAGKRTIQQVVRLDHTHLLFLTTGRFLAPDGLPLAVHGLTPDRAFAGEDIAQLMPPCANSRAPDL